MWMVSPSSATDPDTAATAAWITVVSPRMPSDSHSVRIPSFEVSIAESTSTLSVAS